VYVNVNVTRYSHSPIQDHKRNIEFGIALKVLPLPEYAHEFSIAIYDFKVYGGALAVSSKV